MLQVRRFSRPAFLGRAPFWRSAREPARSIASDTVLYPLRDHQMHVLVSPTAGMQGPGVR